MSETSTYETIRLEPAVDGVATLYLDRPEKMNALDPATYEEITQAFADIERDREVEMVHRGKQYVRAIKLYYKKFGAYPPNMDALVKTNQIRFLRKRYKDPMTGKDDWRIIHVGENKVPAMGLFGQTVGQTGGISPTGATNGANSTGVPDT